MDRKYCGLLVTWFLFIAAPPVPQGKMAWGANPQGDEIYSRFCTLMDREGNPLDADTSDPAAGCEDDWDGQAAHEFWTPIAQLASDTEWAAKLLSLHTITKVIMCMFICISSCYCGC